LSEDDLAVLDRWWRAANYLSVGQIYLLDRPPPDQSVSAELVKPRLLGHWGTTPALNLLWAHLCRVIRRDGREVLFICGPGHGGPAMVASTWLEGSYSEAYPDLPRDGLGMSRLFRQFSFPGGIPSHAAPTTPGSIHEGGELGYSLAHAYGAALDHPDLLVACIIGDGEAETGPLATAWHSNKFLNPATDGAVLPILQLNGYKIANPSVLARIGRDELTSLLEGYGHKPWYVEGDEPDEVHRALAAALDEIVEEIDGIQRAARSQAAPHHGQPERPRWPALVLVTPKGWTGPKVVDGKPVEGTWRAHQVPLDQVRTNAGHRAQLEEWLRSYRPDELFDDHGQPAPDIVALAPEPGRQMGDISYANGGLRARDLELPDFRHHAVAVATPGQPTAEPTRVLGGWLADVMAANAATGNFRVMGPDETASNRLDALYGVTAKAWDAEVLPTDEHLAPGGRVMEILSEHTCQGWLEGYLLTGRHGVFNCYEAFTHIVDSMFNQHAKWLESSSEVPWRRPVPSLNYLLSSHVWRQDHNGFSHQDPGFIDLVVNKRASVVRVYLPPDTNCLLSVADHCLRSRNYVNVIVAGKQPGPSWLGMEQAVLHCTRGLGIWEWASGDGSGQVTGDPDVVLACCGDIPTMETLAAVEIVHERLPDLHVRVVNIVDLMRLQPDSDHPHGLSDRDFDTIFTTDRPVMLAYHGYPWLIHRLTYRRANHNNLHVRGYIERGTTTTPFDMVMLNNLDRYHLVMDVIDRVPGLGSRAADLRQEMDDRRVLARAWTREHGEDIPEVADWQWRA
jgi:xylulose-5-phosphate/fructose-6-phosphate phosphoketolase